MTWAQRLKRVFNIDIEECSPYPTTADTAASGTPWDIASFRREGRATAESALSQINQRERRRVVTGAW
jgi:hypothetical protein